MASSFCKRWEWEDFEGLQKTVPKSYRGMRQHGLIKKLPTMGWNLGEHRMEGHTCGRKEPDNEGKVAAMARRLIERLCCPRLFTSGISHDSFNSLLTLFITPLCRWGNRRWERLHLSWPTIRGQAYLIPKDLVNLPRGTVSRWRIKSLNFTVKARSTL